MMTPPRATQDWDAYFSVLAYHVAGRSKHPRTQHGAVLVNARRRIVATGYNGAPAGFPDAEMDWSPGMTWTSRDWTIHAEENALLQAGLDAAADCTLYVTGLPCPRCLLRIVHAGVARVLCGATGYSKGGEDLPLLERIMGLVPGRLSLEQWQGNRTVPVFSAPLPGPAAPVPPAGPAVP